MSSAAPTAPNRPPTAHQLATPRRALPVARKSSHTIWPIMLLLYAILLPREVRIDLGGLVFFADRIVAFAMLPFLLRRIFIGELRFRIPDAVLLAAAGWLLLSMMRNYGFASGLERGGALAIDLTIGYFLARVCIKSTTDLQRMLALYAPGLLLAGLSMAAESLLAREIIQPLAEGIFGKLPIYASGEVIGFANNRQEFRLGLMRAAGPFLHSILGGLFLASMFSLYFWSALRGWPKRAGVIAAFCSFFSLSSGAILGLLLSMSFVAYDWLQTRIQVLSWNLVGSLALIATILLQLVASGGVISVIVRYLTLNPATGYFRQLIWEFGSNSVRANPLFGIGFQGYERPSWMLTESIDAHWLLLAIRYGLPVSILMLSLAGWTIYVLSKASLLTRGGERQMLRSTAIAIGVVLLIAFTVALNGGINTWFMILIGAGISVSGRLKDGATLPRSNGQSVQVRNHNTKIRPGAVARRST